MTCVDRGVDAFLGGQERGGVDCGVLHHRDDVDQRLVVAGSEGALEVGLGEVLRRPFSASRSARSASGFQSFGRDSRIASASIAAALSADEVDEHGEVVVGLVLLAVRAADEPLRRRPCPSRSARR